MNYKTLVKGAFALSLSLIVGSASASTTVTNDTQLYGAMFETTAATPVGALNDFNYEVGTNITAYANAAQGFGWFSGEAENDESKIVARTDTAGGQALQLNTDASTLTNKFATQLASDLNDGIAAAGAYFETEVKFVPSDTPDAGITGGQDATKFAIYAYANEEAQPPVTNLVVYHGIMDAGGDITYTNEIFDVDIDATQYVNLRVEMKKLTDPENSEAKYNVFSVKVGENEALTSDTALDALFSGTATGKWFLTVEDTGDDDAKVVSSLNFKGTGEIDNIKAGTIATTTTYAIDWTGSENVVVSNGTAEVSGTTGNYEANTVLTFYPTVGLITNVANAAVDPAAASWSYTVLADDTFTVFAGEEPSIPTYAISWTVDKAVVSNTTDNAAIVEAVAGSYPANTVFTFYPTEGSITNVTINGSPEANPASPYVFTVQDAAAELVVKAGEASQERVKPAWAEQADTTKFWNWVDTFNVENYATDYTAQYLMNVDPSKTPVLKIDSIEVTAEGSKIVVSANDGTDPINLASINGVLNVSVGDSVTALSSMSIPAANKPEAAANKVAVIILATDGSFAKATVDFLAAESSLSEVQQQ